MAPTQIVAAHRGSDARREDQIVILPKANEAHPLFKLALAMGLQCIYYRG